MKKEQYIRILNNNFRHSAEKNSLGHQCTFSAQQRPKTLVSSKKQSFAVAQPESLAACIISNEEKSCWLNKSNFTSIFGRGMNHFGLNCLHGEKEGRVYLLCLFVCFCLCIICNCCNVRTRCYATLMNARRNLFFKKINLLVTEMQMQVAAPSNTFTAPLLPLSSFY